MKSDLLAYYARPVPRYTSYPTAPHFGTDINADKVAGWLEALPGGTRLSLYVHIPFCDRLCWFCGCTTKQTNKYAPVAAYLEILTQEIAHVAEKLAGKGDVTALHFGGGSPTLLTGDDMRQLNRVLREHFTFAGDCEISVEIDPNDMDADRHDALADIGMTRASLGLQDFDPKVQAAINRPQSFEETRDVIDNVRARGARSVNTDVLYGLPHQSVETIGKTIEQVLSLRPDRIALFGYAHVPWMKKHQTMISEDSLPDADARVAQQTRAGEMLIAAGYEKIGLDHFALPSDSMAVAARAGTLRRNFQGYTVDNADALIGLGTSAISQLPQGYAQNSPGTGDYKQRVAKHGLATIRGIELSADDRVRAFVIEQLMCNFGFDRSELISRFGDHATPVIDAADYLVASEPGKNFQRTASGYVIAEKGRAFVRTIAAHFDAYLTRNKARHSLAV